MVTYTAKRLLGALPTLFVLISIAFFMIRMAPGGPFDTDRTLPPEMEANLRAAYHLDEPLYQQYGRYLSNIVVGDFGPSFQYKDFTVTELLWTGFPVSLRLGMASITLALFFGTIAGCFAALRQNSKLDHLVMTISMTGVSIPTFVIAPLLILLFAVYLGWLPAGGLGSGGVANFILPTVSLALPQVAYIARLMRGSMIEVLRSPFIRTAKAQGLSIKTIIIRHALKPAMMPVISYLGPATAGIITGSVVIEQIFGIPGL